MMSHISSTPSSKKVQSAKHKQILKQLLKEECNKSCAECKITSHPRWASWSLGCFICIRCSGIHRSMGTHISKVKSVDLDTWTDEQIESMVKWGNEKCNAFWEANLPDGYIPDQSKIENFIRTKYDMKKWAASTTIPNPLKFKSHAKPQSSKPRSSNGEENDLAELASSGTVQEASLLDDDFGAFTSVKPSTIDAPTSTSKATSTHSGKEEIFRAHTAQPDIRSSTDQKRPDLKKSILSLYSSPSAPNSGFIQPHNNLNTASTGNLNRSVSSLSNSLEGLNFGGSTDAAKSQKLNPLRTNNTPAARTTTNSTISTQDSLSNTSVWAFDSSNNSTANQASNHWTPNNSSESASDPAFLRTAGLDDELFKNVWQ